MADERGAPSGASRLGVVVYALLGIGALTAAVIAVSLAVPAFRGGNMAEGMGALAFLPMFTAGVSASVEQFTRGDGSRSAFHLLPLLLVGILLFAASHIVL